MKVRNKCSFTKSNLKYQMRILVLKNPRNFVSVIKSFKYTKKNPFYFLFARIGLLPVNLSFIGECKCVCVYLSLSLWRTGSLFCKNSSCWLAKYLKNPPTHSIKRKICTLHKIIYFKPFFYGLTKPTPIHENIPTPGATYPPVGHNCWCVRKCSEIV